MFVAVFIYREWLFARALASNSPITKLLNYQFSSASSVPLCFKGFGFCFSNYPMTRLGNYQFWFLDDRPHALAHDGRIAQSGLHKLLRGARGIH